MLYSPLVTWRIFLSSVSPGEVVLAHELSNKSYAPIIEQDRAIRFVGVHGLARENDAAWQACIRPYVPIRGSRRSFRKSHPRKKLASGLKSKFAFIYLRDDESTASSELLTPAGSRLNWSRPRRRPKTDFTPYARDRGPDIERAWSDACANKIAASKKPVLLGGRGIGTLSRSFISISDGCILHGGEVGVRAAEAAKLPYWTSSNVSNADSDETDALFFDGHVAVFLSNMSPAWFPSAMSSITRSTHRSSNRPAIRAVGIS